MITEQDWSWGEIALNPTSVLDRWTRNVTRNGAKKRGRALIAGPPSARSHPLSTSLYSAPTLTACGGDAGCRINICPHLLPPWANPVNPLAPETGEGRRVPTGGFRARGPVVAARVPRARRRPGGAAPTYLQPGFPVAATPSDVPAVSAGRRQPYRSRIASEMPIRRHHPGA